MVRTTGSNVRSKKDIAPADVSASVLAHTILGPQQPTNVPAATQTSFQRGENIVKTTDSFVKLDSMKEIKQDGHCMISLQFRFAQ